MAKPGGVIDVLGALVGPKVEDENRRRVLQDALKVPEDTRADREARSRGT